MCCLISSVSSHVYLSTCQTSISLISRTQKEPKTPHSIVPVVWRLTWPCVCVCVCVCPGHRFLILNVYVPVQETGAKGHQYTIADK